jgi:uncharacterized membrane protein YgcG
MARSPIRFNMGRGSQPHSRPVTLGSLAVLLVASGGALILPSRPAVALPTTQPAAERPNGVRDNAKLFQPDAVREVEDVIRQIKQDHLRDLRIETYPSIPGAPNGPDQEQARNRFFTDWIIQRGKALGIRGMMVLIVMDPPHLQVYVGASTEKLFTRADQEELQRKLAQALKDKHYDNALVKTAGFVKERMDRNAGAAAPPAVSAVTPPATFPVTPAMTRASSPCVVRPELLNLGFRTS